ncbi:UDP-N-acetylglucosamine:LPS N-acetylglucosamine transferase [Thermomonospora echinospora]|uniref:UDP-N-acetylglucosamine:LPS N-acetylglucosamine transferase n=2 Tax=Thermomonospora echinospora TaxID=1992 RepID=A0A1H6E521_9ACTN|nr:UDP-N-acetylglucosamine:LPS N-acetylglucosamine transferase [Thermomonospora echinospora]
MGAGHDGVAVELARRLAAAGAEARVVDVLDLLPLGLGRVLRGWYRWTVRACPWLYELIYRRFFLSARSPGAGPLAALAARRLRRAGPCTEVISTFHLAAQVTGLSRARGGLTVPSTVLITDFAVHRMWLHPGNDRYLCLDPAVTRAVSAATGRPARRYAPVVRPEFRRAAPVPARPVRGRDGTRPVLVAAGAWGVGEVEETARALAGSGRYMPIVLCGRNEALRDRLAGAGLDALGWRTDLPELMAAAYALVDNAAGLTCLEALAAGLPVVSHRPIAGHGRDGVRRMARAGLVPAARDTGELLAVLDGLADPDRRARLRARVAEVFAAPPVEDLLMPGLEPAGAPPHGEAGVPSHGEARRSSTGGPP